MGQLTKGLINEQDFELIMTQRNRDHAYWQEEMVRLKTLRDEHQVVSEGLELAYRYLTAIEERLPELDVSQRKLKYLPVESQVKILHERKNIIQSICERVIVHNDGQIETGALIGEQSQLFRGNQSHPGTGLGRVSQCDPPPGLGFYRRALSLSGRGALWQRAARRTWDPLDWGIGGRADCDPKDYGMGPAQKVNLRIAADRKRRLENGPNLYL